MLRRHDFLETVNQHYNDADNEQNYAEVQKHNGRLPNVELVPVRHWVCLWPPEKLWLRAKYPPDPRQTVAVPAQAVEKDGLLGGEADGCEGHEQCAVPEPSGAPWNLLQRVPGEGGADDACYETAL